MAAVLSSDMDHTDKVVTSSTNARGLGLDGRCRPTSTASSFAFTVAGPQHDPLRPRRDQGRGRGRGRGDRRRARARTATSATSSISAGASTSVADQPRVLEALIKSGSLDALGANRATLMQRLAAAHAARRAAHARANAAGQDDLFGGSRGARRRRRPRDDRVPDAPSGATRSGCGRARDARACPHRPSDRRYEQRTARGSSPARIADSRRGRRPAQGGRRSAAART